MENKVDWKVGDRVLYDDAYNDMDIGTVTEVSLTAVWAKWDSDDRVLSFTPGHYAFTKMNSEPTDESAETKAVALLLSLGYTLKKGV